MLREEQVLLKKLFVTKDNQGLEKQIKQSVEEADGNYDEHNP